MRRATRSTRWPMRGPGHRLLVVCCACCFTALLAAVAGLLWLARGPLRAVLIAFVVPLAVPVLGVAALLLIGFVGRWRAGGVEPAAHHRGAAPAAHRAAARDPAAAASARRESRSS